MKWIAVTAAMLLAGCDRVAPQGATTAPAPVVVAATVPTSMQTTAPVTPWNASPASVVAFARKEFDDGLLHAWPARCTEALTTRIAEGLAEATQIEVRSVAVAEISVSGAGPVLICKGSADLDRARKLNPRLQQAVLVYHIQMRESELQKAGLLKVGSTVSVLGEPGIARAATIDSDTVEVRVSLNDAVFN